MSGTSLAEMRKQMAATRNYDGHELDEAAEMLLRTAVREMGLDESVRQKVVQVAGTIANLDGAQHIHNAHVGEAINYRLLRR